VPGERVVVVGGNAAGLTAASRARRLDPRLRISVIEKSANVAYSTCGTPYFLAGDVASSELISMTPADFARDRDIEVHTSVEIDEILPSQRRVTGHRADSGEAVSYRFDRLLLATGVRHQPPDIPGTDLANVFSLVNLNDATTLQPALEASSRIGIVGGGYVGLELAEACHRLGKHVTLYERASHVLPTIDPDMSRIIEYELGRHGVGLRAGTEVTALAGENGTVSGIRTAGGIGVHPVDLALLDTGVAPNVELAASAGVRIGETGGIAVDTHMETNLPGVFAAGNCAETHCLIRNRPIRAHLGTVAAQQGRIAGENLAGRRSRYAGTVGTTVLKVFSLGVGKTGLSSSECGQEKIPVVSARIEALDRASYLRDAARVWIKLIARSENGQIVGMQAAGYGDVTRRIDVAATAITAGMSATDLARLDLAYTPPFGSLWDPIQIAAHAILRQL